MGDVHTEPVYGSVDYYRAKLSTVPSDSMHAAAVGMIDSITDDERSTSHERVEQVRRVLDALAEVSR